MKIVKVQITFILTSLKIYIINNFSVFKSTANKSLQMHLSKNTKWQLLRSTKLAL